MVPVILTYEELNLLQTYYTLANRYSTAGRHEEEIRATFFHKLCTTEARVMRSSKRHEFLMLVSKGPKKQISINTHTSFPHM